MAISVKSGSIFDSKCEAWVNPVNVYPGLMGALAGHFSRRFPGLEQAYVTAAQARTTQLGKVHVFLPPGPVPRLILNLPTVPHPGAAGDLATVVEGLKDLAAVLRERDVKSVALPALGCGVGGLEWDDVKRAVTAWYVEECPDSVLDVELYEPVGGGVPRQTSTR